MQRRMAEAHAPRNAVVRHLGEHGSCFCCSQSSYSGVRLLPCMIGVGCEFRLTWIKRPAGLMSAVHVELHNDWSIYWGAAGTRVRRVGTSRRSYA
jgi:hypothetical protein